MSIKKRALALSINLLKSFIQIVGKEKATLIMAKISESLSPILSQKTDHGAITFFCPGETPEWRARTMLIKEPETIEWINTFNHDDILWDIGANIGIYSLYSALRGLTVLAFEPSPSNYYLLSKNIELNKMDDRISAFCLAFNNNTKIDHFFMADTGLGSSLNSFGEPIDWQGRTYNASLKQAMIGFSIDDFIAEFNPPFPNHIKIDVDGIENKIIEGAKKTLQDKRVKSILIELNAAIKDYKNVVEIIENSGIKIQRKIKHDDNFELFNHIFVRS